MTKSADDIPETEVDRLVDGELTADERRRLLAALDHEPGAWRRCALAFVEAQAWQGEMQRIVSQPPTPKETVRATLPDNAEAASLPGKRSSKTAGLLAAAAALVAAFGLGRWLDGNPAAINEGDHNAMAATRQEAPRAEIAPLGPDADAITLVVQDRSGRAQRIEVPLVEGSQLGQAFAAEPHWADPSVRRQFAERGYELQAQRRYAPLYFEQPSGMVPMIVPVDDAVVTPVSQAVY